MASRRDNLLALGAIPAAAGAWAANQLTAHAWAACGDYEPPYGAALGYLILPLTALTAWAAVAAVVLASSRLRWWWAALLGGLSGPLVAYAWMISAVPMNVPAYYVGSAADGFPECAAAGVPTWWPAFAPLLPGGPERGLAPLALAIAAVALLCLPGVIARRRCRPA